MIPSELSPLWISLETSLAATVLTFVLGLAAAHSMSRYHGPWRGFVDGVLILPLVLPPTVVGFFLLLLLGRRSAIGHALEQIGITIAFSWPATVVAATVVAFPLMYRTALGAFEQVNPNLLGAARTLGASEWRTFRSVLMPLAWPGVMAGTVLAFARALGEFGATLMVAGNIPGRTQTMPVAIFFAAEAGDMQRALAWVICISALSLAIIAALNYWSNSKQPLSPQARTANFVAEKADIERILVTQPPVSIAAAQSGAELKVDLSKFHPTFHLNVAFSTRGGALGLLGSSGSGKSMTLRCIAGLDTPDSGIIELNGRILFDAKNRISLPPARRRVGVVFQDYALFPHLTVEENIAFGLDGLPVDDRQRRVSHWARLVQVEPLVGRYPAELSGGQQQRVALARALAMEPEALLLDEPFSALDTHLRWQLEEQLHQILSQYRGATVFVTHDRNEAFRLCLDLLVLSRGKVAARGPKHELFDNPKSLAVAQMTGCKNLAAMTPAGPQHIRVNNWDCILRARAPLADGASYVGIRAHHVRFVTTADGENTFPCWLLGSIESPFEITLYLRLHRAPEAADHPHLAMEMSREQWSEISLRPQPWHVWLDPARLLLLS